MLFDLNLNYKRVFRHNRRQCRLSPTDPISSLNHANICVVVVESSGQSLNVGSMEELFTISAFHPGDIYQLMGDNWWAQCVLIYLV